MTRVSVEVVEVPLNRPSSAQEVIIDQLSVVTKSLGLIVEDQSMDDRQSEFMEPLVP